MQTLRSLVLLALASCSTTAGLDVDLAEDDAAAMPQVIDGKADGWMVGSTFHVGTRRFDAAAIGSRRVFPLWVAGDGAPVTIDVRAIATDGHDVRVAVLGPLTNGTRQVLGADGYSIKKSDTQLLVELATTGEHQIVVGSYRLERETFFDVSAHCVAGCSEDRLDILASPKSGALVGEGSTRIVSATLGSALANRTFDVELELWASPPAQPWSARNVATSVASGSQVNVIVPSTVMAGDDLSLVVREAGGRILDSGVPTRFFGQQRAFARLDSILYGDIASLEISGVAAFFEGHATLALRSHSRDVEIAQHTIVIDSPGEVGNGFNAFDATFAPEIADEHGVLNPNLPKNGELLNVGVIGGGDGVFRSLGCFEYCASEPPGEPMPLGRNDLSGLEAPGENCTGGPRSCQ